MKIALVKRRYSLRHGGSERYCVNLSRQLQMRGHQVTVIGEAIDDELRDEVEFLPVRVNRLTSSTRNRSFADRCGHVAHAGRFDLVYGLGRSFGLDAVRVTERLQSHWVNVYYQNTMNRLLQRYNPRHRTLIDLERTIYGSPQVRRIVTQSKLDRQLVQQYYGVPDGKLRTIYNGVDTSVFHPGVRAEGQSVREQWGVAPGEPLLIFASMDFEGKGLRYLLQALRACRHREARLLVLGTGPERKFARLARELGVGGRVLFTGRQPTIQRYYGAGDLFLLPTAYEPFPNVNLEAMACGTPVLTTTTAGGADVVVHGENGYLVPAMQAVEEIAASLDYHFSLPAAQRQAMSARCWETARPMTLARNVEQTLELFEEVLLEKFRV